VKKRIKYNRSYFVIFMLVLSVFLLTKCINDESREKGDHKDVTNEDSLAKVSLKEFAGSASCANCHQDIYEKHLHTAHFLTSKPAEEKYIRGSFDPGKNRFYFNRSVVVAMEKRDSGFYQVEYFREKEKKTRRFDIVVGSGTMGQSFLNWRKNYLFQLPITYFTAANQWSNSPGFPDKVVFNRVITSRCLECHTTYAPSISAAGQGPEAFDRNKLILGVDCEKCHGPAVQHIQFHTQNTKASAGKYIINPAKLSRQQNLDLCALCHGGLLQKTKPSFSFSAGDHLSDYFIVDTSAPNPAHIDVHGNQYGLLRASKCYIKSTTLTCNSCHNTHENERGKAKIFSQRCMNCHKEEHGNFCTFKDQVGKAITKNCIDCHMPLKPSRIIAVFLPDSTSPTAALIRSHYISVYPDEAKRLLPVIKKLIQMK
jgi:hypothetical protein